MLYLFPTYTIPYSLRHNLNVITMYNNAKFESLRQNLKCIYPTFLSSLNN